MTLLAGAMVMGTTGTAQATDKGNEQVCTGLDSGKIDVKDPKSVTVTAPEGKLISGYCVKAGSTHNGYGPVYVTLDEPVKTYTIKYPGKDSISHYSVSYTYDTYDECPDLDGDQPKGTDCDRPDDKVKPLKETRSSCEAGVEERKGTQTTTYSFDSESNKWVGTTGPKVWGDWAKVRDLTDKERRELKCDKEDKVTAVNPGVVLSAQCEVEGTYTIPDTEGVQYLLDGKDIDPGTYNGPVSGTLTAEASGKAKLSNPDFSFKLKVPAAEDCPVIVTAVNPGVVLSAQCEVEGTYTIPDTEGVQYLLDGEGIEPGTYNGPVSGTLTAEASGEVQLSNPDFSFELVVPAAEDCPVIAAAETPEVNQSEECDVEGTYTIPSTAGVQYLLDGNPVASGTYSGPVSATVTAVGVGGTILEDPDWEFALLVEAAEVCDEVIGEESEKPTPKPDDKPTVQGTEAVPTAVDAGFGGPVGPAAAPESLLGQGLVGGGLMLLLLAGWLQRGRLLRGAHQF